MSDTISLLDQLPAYQVSAERYLGGSDTLRTVAMISIVYSIIAFLLAGTAAGLALANRKRYRRLLGEAQEEYEYFTDIDSGYLDKFSREFSGRLGTIFASVAGVLDNPLMREQLRVAGSVKWINLSPEMVRIAILEVIEELPAVEEMEKHGVIGGFLHTYHEGFRQMLERGIPPEAAAMNQVTRLLKDHPTLAIDVIKKLFPGYFDLKDYLDAFARKEKAASMQDVLELDARLYPLIIGHLEARVRVEQTKLAWCSRAFDEFTQTQDLEALEDVALNLAEVKTFGETGLSASALAGSARRRATIRILARKIQEARAAIDDVHAITEKLLEGNAKKTALLGNTGQSAIYRRIRDLSERLSRVDAHETSVPHTLERLTAKGNIEAELRAEVEALIKIDMGEIAQEDAEESFEVREARIAKQYEALAEVAFRAWSWARYEAGSSWFASCLTSDYKQEAVFVLMEATEEAPAPSYGVEFRIVHKDTNTRVVSFRYSLASTFSERVGPEQVRSHFIEELQKRRPHVVASMYLDRTERALARRAEYATSYPVRPIELGTNDAARTIGDYYERFYPHEAGVVYLRNLRARLTSNRMNLKDLPTELDDDTTSVEVTERKRAFVEPFASLCTDAERFEPPRLAVVISRETLVRLHEQMLTLRRSGYRVTFNHATRKFSLERPGALWRLSKITVDVDAADLARSFDAANNNLKLAIDQLTRKGGS